MKDKRGPREYRQFGLLVGGIFAVIGLWPAIFRGQNPRLWALMLGAMLILPGLLMPGALAPIYRIWMAAGKALGWINTRLILGAIYYLLLAPAGLAMRLSGRDPMKRGRESNASTYRTLRHPRPARHLKNQF